MEAERFAKAGIDNIPAHIPANHRELLIDLYRLGAKFYTHFEFYRDHQWQSFITHFEALQDMVAAKHVFAPAEFIDYQRRMNEKKVVINNTYERK